jgi:hypothetical protein
VSRYSFHGPWGGFYPFGLLCIFGLCLLYKGARDDIYDFVGEKNAPRWSYIAFGLVCQLPLIGYVAFLYHQRLLPPVNLNL